IPSNRVMGNDMRCEIVIGIDARTHTTDGCLAYSALFDHGLASKFGQRFGHSGAEYANAG
ncbi:hypothetical protein EU454_27555, partial [Salmonella enterica subsp. enterica serovar Java]|nr:hypothetical protein [Salmonella enterica subsp. enterica serovar Java]